MKNPENPVFNTDVNPFTDRTASSSGGNPGGPEPFNESPPAAARDESWEWTLNVRPLGPNEEAVCHMMIGADDLATLSIDDSEALTLGPRGPQGGGKYTETSTSMPIAEGAHKVSLTYSNIPYNPQSGNAAALSYSIEVEVTDRTTGSSSSYVPDDGDPDPVDDDDDGDGDPCECSSSSSDSQSSSSNPCPEDDDNGDGDNGEPSSSCGCDENNGGSSSGASGVRMNVRNPMLSTNSSKYSTAGKRMTTQVRKADMIWRTNFGSFRGMTGMPQGFLEIIARNFSSALWSPSSLAFMHPMASEVTSLPPSGLGKNTAFQISRGATKVNYFTYGDGATVAPIAGSAKRGGSAAFSASIAARNASSSKMAVSVRSNQGDSVTYEADSPSGFGKASAYSTKSGAVYTRPQFEGVLDLVRAADGSIRQIWNLWDGLINIENITANGYRIAFYLPEQVGQKQVGQKQAGLYPVTGDPFKTFDISGDTATKKLTVAEQTNGRMPYVTRYWQGADGAWNMSQGEGEDAVYTLKSKEIVSSDTWKLITTIQRGETGTPVSCVCETWRITGKGNLCTSRIEGYGTDYTRETTYLYNGMGKLVRETAPDGSVKTWSYDTFGREITSTVPWAGDCNKATYTYYRDNTQADPDINYRRVVLTEPATQLSRTDYTYSETNHVRRVEKRTVALGQTGTLLEITETWLGSALNPYARGRLKMTQGIDGIQTSYTYEASSEYGALYKVTAETQIAGEAVPGHSSRKVTWVSEQGNNMRYEQYAMLTDGTWAMTDAETYEYDNENRWIKRTKANGRVYERAMMCCGPLWEKDEDGVTTSYSYNSARQLVETIRSATETTPETIVSYTRDALGKILALRKDIGSMATTESREYDQLGRVVRKTDILGRINTHAYSDAGLTETVTTAAGATLVTKRHADGNILEQSGTGQRHIRYLLDIVGDGVRTTQKSVVGEQEAILEIDVVNGLNQTIRRGTANTLGNCFFDRLTYNEKGKLTQKLRNTGSGGGSLAMAPTLYEYDAFGNIVKETWKLAASPSLSNSKITTYAYSLEQGDDGIYRVIVTTKNNGKGTTYTETTKNLISRLSLVLESKTVSIDPRGNNSTQWTEYGQGTARTSKITIPTSSITAVMTLIDGFETSRTETNGVTTSQSRTYTAQGLRFTQTDGRGNTTVILTDIAERTTSVTDAAGNTTATEYDIATGNPSCVTDALGKTACFAYNARGHKTAEWGTGIQPAAFAYDDADRLISLTTWRASDEEITTNPAGRTDGDTTTWSYYDTGELVQKKTYADGTHEDSEYNALNMGVKKTDARGIITTYTWDVNKGVCTGITFSDGTPPQQFTYNHIGNLYRIVDASGTRNITYNIYNEQETDDIAVNGSKHTVTEAFDAFDRPAGYVLGKGSTALDTVAYGYNTEGRLETASFLHGGEKKTFTYCYLEGSNLLHTIAHPNNILITRSYEEHRDLAISMNATRGATNVVLRGYTYDALGRPVTRSCSRQATTRNDSFAYNDRSELASATLGTTPYAYAYDNIGNRETAQEAAQALTTYATNPLNQYSGITQGEATPFLPEYDAAGNQTKVKTSTGIWAVVYDANNRPTSFTSEDGQTVIACGYDYMGRRFMKKVTVNGAATLHLHYLYRGYLQIAALDLTRSNQPALWFTHWDPTEPVATRPLSIRKNATWYTYGHDLTKNVTEFYNTNGMISSVYDYTPYGAVTAAGPDQPFQWSSEVYDAELGMVYYNYRHYNPMDGRWIGRDPIAEDSGFNLYGFINCNPIWKFDFLGNINMPWCSDPAVQEKAIQALMELENICEQEARRNQYEECIKKCKDLNDERSNDLNDRARDSLSDAYGNMMHNNQESLWERFIKLLSESLGKGIQCAATPGALPISASGTDLSTATGQMIGTTDNMLKYNKCLKKCEEDFNQK